MSSTVMKRRAAPSRNGSSDQMLLMNNNNNNMPINPYGNVGNSSGVGVGSPHSPYNNHNHTTVPNAIGTANANVYYSSEGETDDSVHSHEYNVNNHYHNNATTILPMLTGGSGYPQTLKQRQQLIMIRLTIVIFTVIIFLWILIGMISSDLHEHHVQKLYRQEEEQRMKQNQYNINININNAQQQFASSLQKTTHTRHLLRELPYYTPSMLSTKSPEESMHYKFLFQQYQKHDIVKPKNNNNNNNNNDNDVVVPELLHIVKTRFMQEQGNLTALGEARLALFQVFCHPTIAQQTTQNFIWIIKTDPNLDASILQQLIDIVLDQQVNVVMTTTSTSTSSSSNTGTSNNYYNTTTTTTKTTTSGGQTIDTNFRGNIYVVASNTNFRIANEPTVGAWRDGAEPTELSQSSTFVYTGNRTILEWYMALQSHLPILETRLDADDGLHLGFLQTVQNMANQQFSTSTSSTSSHHENDNHNKGRTTTATATKTAKWMYWCSRRHIEWHWTDPEYFLQSKHKVFTKDDTLTQMIVQYGAIQGVQHTKLCITPGITTGFNVGVSEADVPVFAHDEIISKLQQQQQDNEGKKIDCGLSNSSNCLQFVESFVFEAIRSRTPTSAGMLRIHPDLEELKHQHSWWVTYAFWNMLQSSFGLPRVSLQWVNTYLTTHLIEIAQDNLKGQCTTGHSCKDSAKADLQALMERQQQQQQQQQQEKNKKNVNNNDSGNHHLSLDKVS